MQVSRQSEPVFPSLYKGGIVFSEHYIFREEARFGKAIQIEVFDAILE
jgi:hypothetical protein